MLRWVLIFLVLTVVAAALGFGGIAGSFAGIAKVLCFVFLALFMASLIMGIVRRGGPRDG